VKVDGTARVVAQHVPVDVEAAGSSVRGTRRCEGGGDDGSEASHSGGIGCRPRTLHPVLRRAALLGFGFVALAAAVAVGWLQWLDRFAVRHLMPGLPAHFRRVRHPFHSELVRWLAAVVSLPASTIAAAVLVAAAAIVLWRRRARWEALAGLLSLAAIEIVEVVSRHAVTRPAMKVPVHGGTVRDFGVHASFPSGHTARALLLAALAARLLGRRDRRISAWVAAVALLQELGGFHTPTDVAGGLLLGGALAALVRR
jgi:membrane-associated phospholipid phosphatase